MAAADRHSVLSRGELMGLGLSRGAIEHRLAVGRLHQLHRGVYAVGHPRVSLRGRWRAAVLAAGPGAALSHRSAAALWGIRPQSGGRIEVTAGARRQPGGPVTVHRRRLPGDETAIIDGIRVTSVSRTLLDLAEVLSAVAVERAINEAEMLRLCAEPPIDVLLARYPHKRGSGTMRALIARGRIGQTLLRSELEERFLALIDRSGLPRPLLNATVRTGVRAFECDCVWEAARLAVELDGHASHATRGGFERDRHRDRALQLAGWRVVRITWRQFHEEPGAITADLRTLLAAPATASPTLPGPR